MSTSKLLRAASVPGGPCLRHHPTEGDLGFSSTAAIETNFTIPDARVNPPNGVMSPTPARGIITVSARPVAVRDAHGRFPGMERACGYRLRAELRERRGIRRDDWTRGHTGRPVRHGEVPADDGAFDAGHETGLA
jgi:hypothetical protein